MLGKQLILVFKINISKLFLLRQCGVDYALALCKGNNTSNIEITSTRVFFGPHALYVLDRGDDKVNVSAKGGRGVNSMPTNKINLFSSCDPRKITKHNLIMEKYKRNIIYRVI